MIVPVYRSVEDAWFPPAFLPIAAAAIWLFGTGNRLKRLAPEPRERSARWQAFEKWTKDFPRLKDDPPATPAP